MRHADWPTNLDTKWVVYIQGGVLVPTWEGNWCTNSYTREFEVVYNEASLRASFELLNKKQ